MQLYVGPCHVVSAEIAVAMAVPIENTADCEVRGVIRFLQADAYLRLSCRRGNILLQALVPSDFFQFPKMKEYLAGKRFANYEDLKNAVDDHVA